MVQPSSVPANWSEAADFPIFCWCPFAFFGSYEETCAQRAKKTSKAPQKADFIISVRFAKVDSLSLPSKSETDSRSRRTMALSGLQFCGASRLNDRIWKFCKVLLCAIVQEKHALYFSILSQRNTKQWIFNVKSDEISRTLELPGACVEKRGTLPVVAHVRLTWLTTLSVVAHFAQKFLSRIYYVFHCFSTFFVLRSRGSRASTFEPRTYYCYHWKLRFAQCQLCLSSDLWMSGGDSLSHTIRIFVNFVFPWKNQSYFFGVQQRFLTGCWEFIHSSSSMSVEWDSETSKKF